VEKLDVFGNMRATGKITAGTGAGQGFCLGPSCITAWPTGGDNLGNRNAVGGTITNVANPANPQDAATKGYVDNKISTISLTPGPAGPSGVPGTPGAGMKFAQGNDCSACPYGSIPILLGNSCLVKNETGALFQGSDNAASVHSYGDVCNVNGLGAVRFNFWTY
jgi:hypothetical protein